MNYVRQQDKMLRGFAAFVAAMVVLTLAGAGIPVQAQLPTTIYTFTGNGNPANPLSSAVAQGRDGNYYFATCIPATLDSVLFNISPSGTLTTVYTPINCTPGPTVGTDGNFYSVVNDLSCCGNTLGEIYKVTPTGTATILYTFTGGADGADPNTPPIEGTNGIFYGVTTSNHVPDSTAYSITSSGTFKTLHTFTGSDGQCLSPQLVQGTDGNFYSQTQCGGTNNLGVIFKMTSTGAVTVLHNFAGSDGATGAWPLMQAKDGNFYGTTRAGGTNGAGVLFKITGTGTYTVLYNFPSTGNQYTGNFPISDLIQATNGLLYGVTGNLGGPFAWGAIYSFNTTTSALTTLYSFTGGTDGGQPYGPLMQHTDGLLYGTTYVGGAGSTCTTLEWDGEFVITGGCGTVFTFNIGAKAFINLEQTSGKVGSKVSILGQGFSSSSVVKFGGGVVAAHTLTGTTYISATVPAGASDGKVTVTTGSTTLTSTQTFTVHDSWSSGAAMPTARMGAFTATVGTNVYVIGGLIAGGGLVGVNEIYNTKTNKWTTGTPDPTSRWAGASSVVNGIVYLFGGSNGTFLNLVEAYNPATKTWSTKSPMPTIRQGAAAVVDKTIVYVIGGENNSGFLATVESYNTATDTWTTEASLLAERSFPAAGLLGTTPVAADGNNSSASVGDNEGYNTTLNAWTTLTADPTPRTQGCFSAITGQLYVAGGTGTSGQLSLNEAYSSTKKSWTTLTPMPNGVSLTGSAQAGGLLYCFGGGIYPSTAYNYLQIYQP